MKLSYKKTTFIIITQITKKNLFKKHKKGAVTNLTCLAYILYVMYCLLTVYRLPFPLPCLTLSKPKSGLTFDNFSMLFS